MTKKNQNLCLYLGLSPLLLVVINYEINRRFLIADQDFMKEDSTTNSSLAVNFRREYYRFNINKTVDVQILKCVKTDKYDSLTYQDLKKVAVWDVSPFNYVILKFPDKKEVKLQFSNEFLFIKYLSECNTNKRIEYWPHQKHQYHASL